MNEGLHIPGTLGMEEVAVGAQQQQEIYNRWHTSDAVEQELTSWGLAPMPHPGVAIPVITPELLSGPDSQRYTQVYQQISAWLSYVTNLKARNQARILETTNEMSRIELEVKKVAIQSAKDNGQKKPAKDLLEDLYMSHPRWEQLLLERQKLEQRKLELDSYVSRFERDYKLLSRQVEIRKEEFASNSIGNNMGQRGSPKNPGMYPSR